MTTPGHLPTEVLSWVHDVSRSDRSSRRSRARC